MLLMLSAAGLGSVMSSTGVVAIFIPVVLGIAESMSVPPGRLLMPLSFAGLISGMLTLVATAPNLVVDSALRHAGFGGFGLFSPTPFGLTILAGGNRLFAGDPPLVERQGGHRASQRARPALCST